MKKFIFLSVLALLLGASTNTFAQDHHGRHRGGDDDRHDRDNRGERDDRHDRDDQRGVRSGRITRDEARELRERERVIREQRRANRVIRRDERRQIRDDESEKDRVIHRFRPNGILRPNHNGRGRGWHGRHRRGNGYYRRGAGSPTHPRFGNRS